MNTRAFTLIELLIVIAIVGILAAVLIPQLLGARESANKRAIQNHSSNLYKTITAIYSEDTSINMTALANVIQTNCLNVTTQITVGTTTYLYGWTAPPKAAVACTVSPNSSGTDFLVTVTGNASADNKSSTNGQNPI